MALLSAFALALTIIGCAGSQTSADYGATASAETTVSTPDVSADSSSDSTETDSTTADSTAAAVFSEAMSVSYDSEDLDDTWDESTAVGITLAGDTAKVFGAGAQVNGGKVTITAGGTYLISGSLDDGQIVVDTQDKETVRLVLNGADISCSTSAPIYVASANKTIIVLADGTQNRLTDGESYVLRDEESDEPNAAVFGKSDLTINGDGALTVTANYNNGIASKDDLKIVSGLITVDAVNDGIKGRDCIGIKGGIITITAGGDGMQSNNNVDPAKGYVAIEDGSFKITAQNDGIQAETTLLISGGDFTISTGGGNTSGSAHTDTGWGQGPGRTTSSTATIETTAESTSAKGLKGGSAVLVEGGTLTIDSADDAIHSNGSIRIDGGSLELASGDDAMHADASVGIDGGEIEVSTSYEGIESVTITLRDGIVHLVSTDDAINGISGTTASGATATAAQGPPGESGDAQLVISGGYTAIDAGGDGLDINGTVQMTGGTVLINGPTNDGNGPIDYYGEFKVTGGLLVAVGSSGMAEAPSETSTQYSIMVNFEQSQQPGTLVHIEDQNGEDLLTFSPTKQYQSVLICSPDIQNGSTYTVFVGGNSTGTAADSLYSGGSYTPGTEYASLAVSAITTISGSTGMRGGGPGGGTMPGDGQGIPPGGGR